MGRLRSALIGLCILGSSVAAASGFSGLCTGYAVEQNKEKLALAQRKSDAEMYRERMRDARAQQSNTYGIAGFGTIAAGAGLLGFAMKRD
tara:strand:- start:158 stop:427 length:270 start_codon:yes stop_codon:yes gene_type:complete